MPFAFALTLALSTAAPVPRGPESAVGSAVEYLGGRHTVAAVMSRGGETYYRMTGPDGARPRPGLWVTAASVRAVAERPERSFFIYVDFGAAL